MLPANCLGEQTKPKDSRRRENRGTNKANSRRVRHLVIPLCKTNPIRTVGRWDSGTSGTNKANLRRRADRGGRLIWLSGGQALAAGRPGQRYKQSQFGAVPGGMGLGPGPEVLLSALTPVASGLFRCRPYKRSQFVTWKESSPGRNRGYETTDERHHRVQTKPIPGGTDGTAVFRRYKRSQFPPGQLSAQAHRTPDARRMRWGTRKRLAASLRARGRTCETKPIGRRALSGRETPLLRPWGPGPGRTQSRSVAPPGMSLRAQRSNLPC